MRIMQPRTSFALIGAALLATGVTSMAVAAQNQAAQPLCYGVCQPPPPPIPVPGGFLTVVTSQSVGPGGGSVGPVSAGNTETEVTVPPGGFTTPLDVTITTPSVPNIGRADFCGYQAVAGVGVIIQNPSDGSVNNSFFTHPLVVTITSPDIKPGNIIVAWNGVKFVKVSAIIANGTATIKLDRAGYHFFAILAPTGTSGLDPCSTSSGG